jgi:hypothetical protein
MDKGRAPSRPSERKDPKQSPAPTRRIPGENEQALREAARGEISERKMMYEYGHVTIGISYWNGRPKRDSREIVNQRAASARRLS